MNAPPKEKARPGEHPAGREVAPGIVSKPNDSDNTSAAQAAGGKSLAVWLYLINARSETETIRTFERHPHWKNA